MKLRLGIALLAIAIPATVWLTSRSPGTIARADSEVPAAQSPQPPAEPPKAYEGVITDTRCGAKHTAALAETAADCTRICVHSGEKFALVDGDKMYTLQGESEVLKRSAGERVKVMGTLTGKTISVVSVTPQ